MRQLQRRDKGLGLGIIHTAMLSNSIITRLRHQHETLEELVSGFTEEQLRQRILPDKWSIHEQAAHLAAYQPAFYGRLQRMQQENNPLFDRYVADNDPHFHECCKESITWLLNYLADKRTLINTYLLTYGEQALQHTGRHPKYGVMSIIGWTEFFLLHEAHHLFSIFMLAREMNIKSQQGESYNFNQ